MDEELEVQETPWDEMHMMFEDDEGEFHSEAYVWCLHCERAYKMAEMVRVEDLWYCKHYPECDGTLIAVRGWARERECYHPEWPQVPIGGTVYPMYAMAERG